MTKPMYCPMSFHTFIVNTDSSTQRMPSMHECTPDCAWAVIPYPHNVDGEIYGCAMALGKLNLESCNTRPLKDDAE